MYNVSSDFLTAVRQPGRVFKSKATVKKTGYADLNLTDAQILSMRLSSSSISGDDFEIGTTCAAQLDIEIANLDGSLSTAAFQDAQVLASIGVLLANGMTVEYCPLGVFYVDMPSRTDSSIKLTCYDAMVQLETLYQSTLTYPATLLQIAQDIAAKAGLVLATTSFPNASFSVSTAPNLAGVTLRSALSWVAQASSTFARINRDGKMELAFYTATSTAITAGNYFNFTHDDQPRAAITQVTIKQTDDDTGVSNGTAGNTYTITGNPLFVNNPSGALTAIFNQLNGFSYMPFQSDWQGNPACMVGDAITMTDRANNTYSTIFTECDLVYEGGIKGTAEAKALSATGQNHQTPSAVSSAANTAVQTAQQASYDVAQINNLLAGNITATNIATGTITADKLKAGTITAASGIIASAAIDTAQIKDAAVVTAKIADAAISTAKIANTAITTAQISTGAITTALIGTGAVNTAQIADGSITDAKIVTLTANKLTAGTIDASKITVTNLNCANLTVGTINGTQIGSGVITSSNIADGTIQGTDIKSGTITNSLISASTITGDRLVAGTITASQIASATITGNNIAANTITAGNIAAATITAAQIAGGTITGDKIAAGTIDASKINVTTLTAQSLNPSGNNFVTCGSVTIAYPPSDTTYTGYGLLFENSTLSNPVVASLTYDTTASPILFNSPNGFQLACVTSGANHAGLSAALSINNTIGLSFNNYGGSAGFSCGTDGTFNVAGLNCSSGASFGSINATGQIHMSGSTYPQIYGNGSVLQINLSNEGSSNGIVISGGTVRPPGDAQVNLGASGHRWATVYAAAGTINTSDRNEKSSIVSLDMDKAAAFIAALNPVSYKFNDGTSGRTHYGMIAQDVEDEMAALGMSSFDFAGLIKSPKITEKYDKDENGNPILTEIQIPGEYLYGLRYEEFIAPLIKVVQGLLARCSALEKIIGRGV